MLYHYLCTRMFITMIYVLNSNEKNLLSSTWHNGSSVNNKGLTLRSLFFSLQFLTAAFQSQVCFSMSKYKPAGQRIACNPCKI